MKYEGEEFGKYRIVSPLGRGGSGAVYVAEDVTLGRHVALKILDRSFTRDGQIEELLRHEARMVASIEHPHIVRIHSLERVGEDLAIDMEFMRGGSLASLLRNGPCSPQDTVNCAAQVLDALASCHAAGVVHRDVKPANILIDDLGRCALSDFGLAKMLSVHQAEAITAATSADFFVGTPRYAPPEAWEGQDPTPAWDVYSMGVVLYEMLCGEPPYLAQTPLAYIKLLLDAPAKPLETRAPKLSPELCSVVTRMMDRNANARPADANAALLLIQGTPEYLETTLHDTIVIKRLDHRSTPRRRIRRRPFAANKRKSRRIALWSGILLLMALLSGYGMASHHVRRFFGNDPRQVYDTLDIEQNEAWPAHLLAVDLPGGQESDLVAAESTHLWYLHENRSEAASTTLSGFWAEYSDTSARVFRHGTLSGTGRRETDGKQTLSLEFLNTEDGARTTRSFRIIPSTDVDADTFLASLRRADYVVPMLFNELLPRQLPWAETLERKFFPGGQGLVSVHRSAASAIHLDGKLDEPVWNERGHPVVATLPGPSANVLYLLRDMQYLYLGLRCGQLSPDSAVAVTVVNAFGIPIDSSSSWRIQIDKGGAAQVVHDSKTHYIAPDATVDFAFEVDTIEIRIPFAIVDEPGGPASGDRWKLGCQITDKSTQQVVAAWGNFETCAEGLTLNFVAEDDS